MLDLAVSITQGGPQMITATFVYANATQGVAGTVNVRTAIHNAKGVSRSTFQRRTPLWALRGKLLLR